jgi:hypothetical protein
VNLQYVSYNLQQYGGAVCMVRYESKHSILAEFSVN